MPRIRRYWLFKSDASSFSIQDLAASPDQTTFWDGVRNYQARNLLRDEVKKGERLLFYHSSANPPAVAGIAEVVREAYPDHTAWTPGEKHFDAKTSPDNPTWVMVDIRLEEIFDQPVPLDELRGISALEKMEVLRRGSRLSIQPVRKNEFDTIVKLGRRGKSKMKRS